MNLFVKAAVLNFALVSSLLGAAQATTQVSDAEIAALVKPFIDEGYLQGLVVGIIDARGSRILGFGRVRDQEAAAPDGRTVFEIGSVTKVFTSLLLSDMAQRRQVPLDDPVQKYLPDSVLLRQHGEIPITLLDLATHRSGLPRMPGNFEAFDSIDPYASYTPERLYPFLDDWKPGVAPGKTIAYSNLGAGLLGHVLARRAGISYEQLLITRIIEPLRMDDTSITLSPSQSSRLAQPHDRDGNVGHNWHFTDALAGAGAMRSTGDDMLIFLQAQLSPPQDDLGKAITQTHIRRGPYTDQLDIGLGWLRSRRGTIWHNGTTGGYHSFVAFNPDRQIGIVVLANNAGKWSEVIGSRVLSRLMGIDPGPAPTIRHAVKLDAGQLDRLTGDYFTGLSLLTIRRDGDRLLARMMGQPEMRIYPDSASSCFWKAVDAQADFTFGSEPGGRAIRLVLHQDGRDSYAVRVPATPPASQPTIRP